MLDALGHPLEAGTVVLTPPYYSTCFNLVTTIEKTTKTAVYVRLPNHTWNRENNEWVQETQLVRRRPDQMVAIGAQYKHNAENYPEYMI